MLESRPLGRIRFQLLGPAALFAGHPSSAVRVSAQKGLALLAYLAMNAGRPVGRAVLADLLWGDRVEAQARQSLRQAILTLRRDLGLACSSVVYVDDQTLSLSVESDDVDALQFVACAASPDPTQRQRCLDMPWAPFLDNFSVGTEPFDDWVVAERHRLDAIATRTFAELANHFDAAGDGERAIRALERLIAIDPGEEARHRRLLSLEARYRGTDAALARAKQLSALLEREFDATPEPATRALVETLRQSDHHKTQPERPRPDPETPPVNADPAGLAPSRRQASAWRRGRAAAAFAAIAVVVAGGYFALTVNTTPPARNADATDSSDVQPHWQSPTLPSRPQRTSAGSVASGVTPIAVLPFTVYGDAGSQEGLAADMLTDDLTFSLSRLAGLRVIAQQTMRTYRGQLVDATRIGTELNVRYLLEGSVRLIGNTLRVNVALIDATNGLHLWNGRFEQDAADPETIQTEIVARLARELQVEVYQAEGRRGGSNPDAMALTFQGWSAIFAHTREGEPALERAEAALRQALVLAPDNARAQTGLAAVHVIRATLLSDNDNERHLVEAEALLNDVLARHRDSFGTHYVLALVHARRGRTDEAIRSFETSLELSPSNATAYAHLGNTLLNAGRLDEAIAQIRYAMRLSPKDPGLPLWLTFAAGVEIERGAYADAIAHLNLAAATAPRNIRVLGSLAAAYALSGRMDEARRYLATIRELAPHVSDDRLIGSFGGKNKHRAKLGAGMRMVLAPSWESPTLPSRAAGNSIARERGLVAIAVLPFRSHSENGEGTGLVAEMLTEDLTYLLSRVPVFRVISHQTAVSYRGQSIDSAAIGAELGVHYLVEGNISTRGNILRVNVALVDARNRLQIWSGRFERTGEDRHAVQAEIVNGLARELHVSVLTTESGRTSTNPDVHELIFRGFAAIQAARLKGVEAIRPAETYFLQALERDPDAIRAQVGLGAYHAHMAVQLFAPDPAPHLVKAEAILQQVIDRHPNLSDAHSQMGLVHVARGHMDKALQSFERAVEFNPSNAPSHAQIGRALVSLGQPQAGLEHVLYAMQLSPRDPILGYWLAFAGYALLELTRYDEAIDYLARAHATNPTQPRTALTYIAALAMADRMGEARLKLEQLQKTHPHLTRERILNMYSKQPAGRLRTIDGIRRVLAAEEADQSSPTK